ncbi:type III PLP-dependent enzyme [Frigidibacter sp. MR17.14]|uniref:type III PLP-dependent enzyme n=1 Tax=Frigidibacter sp. MR17.14 TaxID=3126509 RepID=UPI003012E80A
MGLSKTIWSSPTELLRTQTPDNPVMFFAPTVLQATARRFIAGFPGMVTYAVKSNPDEMVVQNLVAAGIRGFDVASPAEIEMIRRLAPTAALHYNNPVRGRAEIAAAVAAEVRSWSVDSASELAKLVAMVPVAFDAGPVEISVRYKLPVPGAAYNFGAKFGAVPERAAELLAQVAAAGFLPSLTFHPGTQCTDAAAWQAYVQAGADICRAAGVRAHRLNVGGGFPSHRRADIAPPLEQIFARIDAAVSDAFGADRPELVCEPGRGLVADAFSLAARVKAVRDDACVFLNDGLYGNLAELPDVGPIDRIEVIAPDGQRRTGAPRARTVFGPTCDSVDRLPGDLALPGDLDEGDYLLIHGMGAYSTATNTRFNGFGDVTHATTLSLR